MTKPCAPMCPLAPLIVTSAGSLASLTTAPAAGPPLFLTVTVYSSTSLTLTFSSAPSGRGPSASTRYTALSMLSTGAPALQTA